MKIQKGFYTRSDVVQVARDLLGKYLFTCFNGTVTGGVITETEAYAGETDRASHAWQGRRTARTEIMYAEGGVAYVYLCYGIHSLFNIVTNIEGVPHAVLVRSVFPTTGLETIFSRMGGARPLQRIGEGPGRAARVLGIHYSHSGTLLSGDSIWLEDKGLDVPVDAVATTARVGVGYAGEDALRPYRFVLDTAMTGLRA